MENNKVVMIVVGAVVSIVLITSMLIPVIATATSGNGGGGDYVNEGQFRYAPITPTTNEVIKLERVGDVFNLSIDDEIAYTIPVVADMDVFLPLFIAYTDEEGAEYIGVQFSNDTFKDNRITFHDLYSDNDDSVDSFATSPYIFTITDGVVDYTIGDFYPYFGDSFIYMIDPNGDYIYSNNPVVQSDTKVYFVDNYEDVELEEEHESDYDIFYYLRGYGTVSDFQITSHLNLVSSTLNVSDFNGAIKIDSVTFTFSTNPETVEDDRTATIEGRCIVPMVVSGAGGSSGGLSPTLNTVLSIIPLLMVVGVIMFVIGGVIVRRW